jgi:hypothetical protein
MFIAPRIIRKNIACRKWQRHFRQAGRLFRRSWVINISSPSLRKPGTKLPEALRIARIAGLTPVVPSRRLLPCFLMPRFA